MNKQYSKFISRLKKEGILKASLRMLRFVLIRGSRFMQSIPYFLKRMTGEWATKEINGSKMKLYLKDRGISKDLYVYGKREPFLTDYLIHAGIVRPGDTVLDIGANIGYYALLESKLAGASGVVYAVEPSPFNAGILKENIQLNGYKNIEVFNLAMGDHPGKAKMFISEHLNLCRLEETQEEDIVETIDVDVITVDQFLQDRRQPNLIRMDVEGYEYQIIKGMARTLNSIDRLTILVEYHIHLLSREQHMEIFNILEKNGFLLKCCLLDPAAVEKNPITVSISRILGERNFYGGKYKDMNLSKVREWIYDAEGFNPRAGHLVFQKR